MSLEKAQMSRCLPASKQLHTTTCPYCGVGCAVDIELDTRLDLNGPQRGLSKVSGTPDHPANFGRLCVKGSKLLATNTLDGRLLHPQVNDQQTTWKNAINTVATKFSQVIAEHGPDAVAFYVSGQLLTEDYYVANKLMKGFIGSANIDTNSRLCMSSAVAAYKRAFGADAVPCCYEDLERSELLILIGSNAAWTHPVLFQRMERAKQLNPNLQVVLVDPRRTASCELADFHLPIKPGTDVALFNGLLNYLALHSATDHSYIEQYTEGFEETLTEAFKWTPNKVATYCDIDLLALEHFYELFARTDRVVSFYSMGVNQSSSGVDKANAIINCHLATGKLGREGCGPFSITGQPNAMGGREVGGMANMLAAHMDIENAKHRSLVQDYWQSPIIADQPGLKAIDLFEQMEQGKIKALWVMATNPVVSMPNRNKIEKALKKCELVVVSDCVAKNDTLSFAHVKLPACGWSEKNGTVTNSERRISRQRGILPPPGEAKHDWQIICEVATAMGHGKAFTYQHPAQIFAEHAGLTAYHNNGSRDLDLSGLCHLTQADYDALRPLQWPVNQANPQGTKRLFTDKGFFTPTNKAQFIAVKPKPAQQSTSEQYPFVLNSGRIRDQWHTMTRSGNTAELSRHIDQAFVAMHPTTADNLQIKEGDLVALCSAQSLTDEQVVLSAKLDQHLRETDLFVPIHWSRSWSSSASVASLYSDANDSVSGQPELKHGAVKLKKVTFKHYGQIFSTTVIANKLLDETFDYWTKSPIEGGYLYRFAMGSSESAYTENKPNDFELTHWLQQSFPLISQWMSVQSQQHHYLWALVEDKLFLAAFFGDSPLDVDQDWLTSLLNQDSLQTTHKTALLRAKPEQSFSQGRLLCSCFKVGEKAIIHAIQQGCTSVDALGQTLQCGTNCGSCKPELSQLISQYQSDQGQSLVSNDVRLIALEAV